MLYFVGIILVGAIIWIGLFFLSGLIVKKRKYSSERSWDIRVLITSLGCLIFFGLIGILSQYHGLGYSIITPAWYIMFPFSCLSLLFSIVSLLFKKNL